MQEHALAVSALFMSKPGRAVLGSAQLGLESPFAILGPVDGLDAALSIFLLLESHIYSERLVLPILILPVANRNLLDVAILPKKLRLPESFQELILSYGGGQTGDVDEVLLDNANADEVLARVLFRIAFLDLLLTLEFGALLLGGLLSGLEFGLPIKLSAEQLGGVIYRGTNSSAVTALYCIVLSS